MIKLFLPVLLFFNVQLNGYAIHEYYVGITELTYNSEKQRVEIIARLFFDDLERVLQERYSPELSLEPEGPSKDIEAYIKLYFNKKLIVSIDGEEKTMEYLGYKFEQDRINIYLKINNITELKEMKVENLLLTDLFEDQKNIIHGFKNKQKRSVVSTKYDYEHLLKFD